MSRFNNEVSNKTENRAGGEAFSQTPELALVSFLFSNFLQAKHYESADESVERLIKLIGKVNPQFAAKASIYARQELGMRSVSHVVAATVAHSIKGESWVKSYIEKTIKRPDDVTEIVSYVLAKYGKPIPNSLKRGLGKALGKFDEYQLGKYKASGKAVSLVDVVNLVHPMSTEAIKKLVDGTLKPSFTWETQLSAAGSDEQKRTTAWTTLVKERKIGYFALLRNLRNIASDSPELVEDAAAMLTDDKLIEKSLVLPFRYMAAYKALMAENNAAARKLIVALDVALTKSVKNLPILDGETLVVVDHSGSMDSTVSSNSDMTMFETGALLGVAMAKANGSDFMYFGDIAKYYNVSPTAGVLDTLNLLASCNNYAWGSGFGDMAVGHGTNFHSIFQTANKKYDRIILFSDMQAWSGYNVASDSLNEYKRNHGANPKVYSFDLAGYGDMQFPEQNVVALAGFSDKVFDLIKFVESDKNAVVKAINEIQL